MTSNNALNNPVGDSDDKAVQANVRGSPDKEVIRPVIRRHSGEGAVPTVEYAEVARPPKDSLADLIDSATPHVADNGSKKAGAAAGHPLPKSAIVAGMNLIRPKIAACYSEFKIPGIAMAERSSSPGGEASPRRQSSGSSRGHQPAPASRER